MAHASQVTPLFPYFPDMSTLRLDMQQSGLSPEEQIEMTKEIAQATAKNQTEAQSDQQQQANAVHAANLAKAQQAVALAKAMKTAQEQTAQKQVNEAREVSEPPDSPESWPALTPIAPVTQSHQSHRNGSRTSRTSMWLTRDTLRVCHGSPKLRETRRIVQLLTAPHPQTA